jgi:ring-1,2-phenylacetyl-CoA epoxidase subunit PaaC
MTMPALATYALRLGDDALVLSHRLGEWVTNAPQLEEDVALANIGLDLLGQARTLLSYAGEVEAAGRTEDDLAYLRDEREFLNVHLVERPNEDFAVSMARQLLFSTYQLALYEQLQDSADPTLAGMAAKAVKEVDYHRDHATQWVLRLGDGTDESHRRAQAGVDAVWPLLDDLFVATDVERRLTQVGVAVDPAGARDEVRSVLTQVLEHATLRVPEWPADTPPRGRVGEHGPELAELLGTLQGLARQHPAATW